MEKGAADALPFLLSLEVVIPYMEGLVLRWDEGHSRVTNFRLWFGFLTEKNQTSGNQNFNNLCWKTNHLVSFGSGAGKGFEPFGK